MLKFYYSAAPNPTKIALFLEESGLPYDPIPVDTRKGDQHKPEYLAINPNAKVPAIVDGAIVFDSSAILLYRRKTGKFLQRRPTRRAANSVWMFSCHPASVLPASRCISIYAPEKLPTPSTIREAQRHFDSMRASLRHAG
jgi:GST-like protein